MGPPCTSSCVRNGPTAHSLGAWFVQNSASSPSLVAPRLRGGRDRRRPLLAGGSIYRGGSSFGFFFLVLAEPPGVQRPYIIISCIYLDIASGIPGCQTSVLNHQPSLEPCRQKSDLRRGEKNKGGCGESASSRPPEWPQQNPPVCGVGNGLSALCVLQFPRLSAVEQILPGRQSPTTLTLADAAGVCWDRDQSAAAGGKKKPAFLPLPCCLPGTNAIDWRLPRLCGEVKLFSAIFSGIRRRRAYPSVVLPERSTEAQYLGRLGR